MLPIAATATAKLKMIVVTAVHSGNGLIRSASSGTTIVSPG
jgi:hypothetical protein